MSSITVFRMEPRRPSEGALNVEDERVGFVIIADVVDTVLLESFQ
jgi:hypothetical protein